MPIYEYRCGDCQRSFEALVSLGEQAAECPRCRGANLSRELSVFAAGRNGAAAGEAAVAPPAGGGCCGGACGCR